MAEDSEGLDLVVLLWSQYEDPIMVKDRKADGIALNIKEPVTIVN